MKLYQGEQKLNNSHEFIRKLISSQEPLGEKFTEVLMPNLWDHRDHTSEVETE